MNFADTAILVCYFGILGVLSVFGWHCSYVVYLYFRHRERRPHAAGPLDPLPTVTIQLPIYNELYVVDRLLDAVSRIDYPRDLLEIQVLDDSTDETRTISELATRRIAARGIDIKHYHRADRVGFKAGALEAGLAVAKGQYIAIFDADFLPPPDFLRRLLPYFAHGDVGMVQARWGHLNQKHSLLTKIQALMLDAHFVFEHAGRCRSGRFVNFTGTAGIWRREAIVLAGGWQNDTLTEDLDLSYRAQLGGWRFVFLPDVVSPAELPVEMNALKSQQRRWTTGGVQTCRKLLPSILRAKLPLAVKAEALFHLTSPFCHALMFALSILVFPAVFLLAKIGALPWYETLLVNVLLVSSSLSALNFYALSQRELHSDWMRRLRYLPFLFAIGIGLSVNNTRAIADALLRRPIKFMRTPKYGTVDGSGSADWGRKKYRQTMAVQPLVELAFATYFTAASFCLLAHGFYQALPSIVIFQFGFLYTSVLSLSQQRLGKPRPLRIGAAGREGEGAGPVA